MRKFMKMDLNGCFCACISIICTHLSIIISRMSHASYFIRLFASVVLVFSMRYAHLSHCHSVFFSSIAWKCGCCRCCWWWCFCRGRNIRFPNNNRKWARFFLLLLSPHSYRFSTSFSTSFHFFVRINRCWAKPKHKFPCQIQYTCTYSIL